LTWQKYTYLLHLHLSTLIGSVCDQMFCLSNLHLCNAGVRFVTKKPLIFVLGNV